MNLSSHVGRVTLGLAIVLGSFALSNSAPSSQAGPASDVAPHLVIEAGGHQAIIRKLLFTADERELISVSDDKTVRIWSVSPDGRRATLARTLRGQLGAGREGQLAAAALSPPDAMGRQQWLAVGGYLAGSATVQHAIRLHDYASGEVHTLLHGHDDLVLALAFAPSGRWLASAGKDTTIRLWDLSVLQGQDLTYSPLVLRQHTDPIYDLAWSPDGTRLASASDDHTVSLWQTEHLNQNKVSLLKRLQGHDLQVTSVAFHPNGAALVSGSKDQTLRLWRARDGKSLGVFARTAQQATALAFSPDGQALLAGRIGGSDNPKRITLYDYPAGTERRVFTGHDNIVLATALHPSGQWAASGGGDHKEILLWDIKTGEVLSRLAGRGQTIWAVGFSPDGRSIHWGQTFAYISDLDRGPLEYHFDFDALHLRKDGLSPSTAIRAKGHVEPFKLVTERSGPQDYPTRLSIQHGSQRLGTIERGPTDGYRHSAYTFTPKGEYVLSGGLNGVLTLYTREGQTRARLVGHTGEIKTVAVSADGRWAVSGASDQTLNLWSLAALSCKDGIAMLLPTFTLFPSTDGEWVAWAPEGFFAASPHGTKLIGYSLNQGLDKLATYVSFDQLFDRFYRPDLLDEKLRHNADPCAKSSAPDVEDVLKILPPQVAFISPQTDLTVDQSHLDVRVRITDKGGGIGRVEWKINGLTVDVVGRMNSNTALQTSLSEAVELTQQIALGSGKNSLDVIAYNRNHEVASAPASLTVIRHTAAPQVAFVSPANGTIVDHPTIDVHIIVQDQGSGISKVEWKVTPELTARDEIYTDYGPFQLSSRGYTVELTKRLPLAPGKNLLEIMAYDRQYDAAAPALLTVIRSETPAITSNTQGPVTAPEQKPSSSSPAIQDISSGIPQPLTATDVSLHVIVVGIDRYDDPDLQLSFAVSDARALGADICKTARSLFRKIIVTEVFNARATLAGIETAIKTVASQTTIDDVFVLYLAGHGVTRDGNYFFIPRNFPHRRAEPSVHNAITQEHLQSWLAMVQARKSLVLIDTCESGSFTKFQVQSDHRHILNRSGSTRGLQPSQVRVTPQEDSKTEKIASSCEAILRSQTQLASHGVAKNAVSAKRVPPPTAAQQRQRQIAANIAATKLRRATGRATIVASTSEQVALEGIYGHGAFTYVLLQALNHADRAYGNSDGIISSFELAHYVDGEVPTITQKSFGYAQLPQVSIVGSDFPIGMVGMPER